MILAIACAACWLVAAVFQTWSFFTLRSLGRSDRWLSLFNAVVSVVLVALYAFQAFRLSLPAEVAP